MKTGFSIKYKRKSEDPEFSREMLFIYPGCQSLKIKQRNIEKNKKGGSGQMITQPRFGFHLIDMNQFNHLFRNHSDQHKL